VSEINATFRWTDGAMELLDDCDVVDRRLEAVDSFLVDNGQVLAVELHRRRFVSTAMARGYPDEAELNAFWDSAMGLVPDEIQWFPRYEFATRRGAHQLQFLLRSAPALTDSVRLFTYRGTDPRTEPALKGPDLEAMLRLRQSAQRAGADEAVILTADATAGAASARDSAPISTAGVIADGSTSAIMWWREQTLCIPPGSIPRVDSVTAATILTIATATGVSIAEERAQPADLEGCEVWAVNALHGIRAVTSWIDGPEVAPVATRAPLWRKRLKALATRLTSDPLR
jgi:branched-subunit amino acid aminotransferase/4-amino-4-deoxychorismate lyase